MESLDIYVIFSYGFCPECPALLEIVKFFTCIYLQMNNFATFGEILNPGLSIRTGKVIFGDVVPGF